MSGNLGAEARGFVSKFLSNKIQHLVTTAIVFFLPLAAFAGEVAHGEEGHAHSSHGFQDLIPFWINFIIYCAALYFILRKRIASGLKARSARVEEQVNRGARELENAKRLLDEAERKLATASNEAKRIQEEIRRDAQNEAAQVIRDAAERAERVKSQAKELATAEQKATENAIKRELSEIVIKKVTERIARELNAENDRGRRAAALRSVSALVGKS